jgi:hypothetical protein
MFEKPAGKEEKDRSRLIILLSGAAVVIVIGLILLSRACPADSSEKLSLARQGEDEFDNYAPLIEISNVNRTTAERLGNQVGIIRCRVKNTGDKIITALQLKGVAWGDGNEDQVYEVIKESVSTPVPRQRETLGPGQAVQVEIYIEPLPELSAVKEMTIELYGLKVRQ